MKEKILEALRTKFPGRSAVILGRIADKLAKTATTPEQVTTAVEGVTTELIEVIESYGDSRATEASTTAVSNYEAKYSLKDGKPATTPEPKGNGGGGEKEEAPKGKTNESTPEREDALIEQIKKLNERMNTMERERTTTGRRQALEAIYGRLPEPLRKTYERLPLDGLSDEEFTKLTTEVTAEVGEIGKTLSAKGAVFTAPSSHSGASAAQELTKEQIETINNRGGIPTSGQPF